MSGISSAPLQRKDTLDPKDVIGRGVLGSKNHPGNVEYRKLVEGKCEKYIGGTKQQKDKLVDEIKTRCGDFVYKRKQDGPGGPWYVRNLTERNDAIRCALNSKANEDDRKKNRKRRIDKQDTTVTKGRVVVKQRSSEKKVVLSDEDSNNCLQPVVEGLNLSSRALFGPCSKQNRVILEALECHSPLDVLSLLSSVKQALLTNPAEL
eukprot:CAMPEP_0119005956 /NCGR_PEP_ID=MMETSP1176-20130426/2029_1 /TAXON_ID=265551 /ORGANISM="Synedropsis recta cf, Strain CCMP1620" /LENGTH=205 /DNA_ID=CAMNT_0006957821 /DNA_START=53 /DNA_END=670 /DNA_ORIENTATION=+